MIRVPPRIAVMECCRNVLLYLFYEETNRQLEKAGAGAKSSINIADILAYSLNRITPLFLCREMEWQKQLSWHKESLGELVSERVRKAILQARKPRLQTVHPLPANELSSPMHTLIRLRLLLENPEMTWATLPQTLEEVLGQGPKGGKAGQFLPNKPKEGSKISAQDYNTYLLPAQFKMVHALEAIIYRLTLKRLDSLPAKLAPYSRLIPIDEVMTLALGCLPPMYATTDEGIKRLRYHARMQIGSEIAEVVTRSVVEVGQTVSRTSSSPTLLFQEIRKERQEAMAKLNWMLKRKNITWENAPQVIAAAIDSLRSTGDLVWQRLPTEGI